MWIGTVAWIISYILKKPYIIRLRGDAKTELEIRNHRIMLIIYEKILLKQANIVICVSNYLKETIKRSLNQKDHCKISVVPTPQEIHLEKCIDFCSRKHKLLIVTSFRLKDKISKLIGMSKEIDKLLAEDFRLSIHVFGDGNYLYLFEHEIKKIENSERVFFHGHCNNIDEHYTSAFALLHVSELDAYPSVVNEARAYCLPVIVSNDVGMKEQVINNVDGLIIDHNQSLLDAWKILQEKHNWDRLSHNGLRRVQNENSEVIIGQRFYACLSKLGIKKIP
jgi:glycosyltransferase involved in cell wall biosynthesis